MGKNNQGGNNNRNKDNYFEQQIKKNGGNTNFFKMKDPKTLSRDCVRIFRDISFGNIDPVKYGMYFTDPQFLAMMIATATTKLAIPSISAMGVQMLADSLPVTENKDLVIAVLNEHKKAKEAYEIILEMLNVVRLTGDVYQMVQYVQRLHNSYRGAI